jgi:hypothetical protein
MNPTPQLESGPHFVHGQRHGFNPFMRLFLFQTLAPVLWASLLLATAACVSAHVDYLEGALRQPSQEELIQKFGYPQRVKRAFDGATVWEYEFVQLDDRCTRYILTFDAEDHLRQWERQDCRQESGKRNEPG